MILDNKKPCPSHFFAVVKYLHTAGTFGLHIIFFWDFLCMLHVSLMIACQLEEFPRGSDENSNQMAKYLNTNNATQLLQYVIISEHRSHSNMAEFQYLSVICTGLDKQCFLLFTSLQKYYTFKQFYKRGRHIIVSYRGFYGIVEVPITCSTQKGV